MDQSVLCRMLGHYLILPLRRHLPCKKPNQQEGSTLQCANSETWRNVGHPNRKGENPSPLNFSVCFQNGHRAFHFLSYFLAFVPMIGFWRMHVWLTAPITLLCYNYMFCCYWVECYSGGFAYELRPSCLLNRCSPSTCSRHHILCCRARSRIVSSDPTSSGWDRIMSSAVYPPSSIFSPCPNLQAYS